MRWMRYRNYYLIKGMVYRAIAPIAILYPNGGRQLWVAVRGEDYIL